ncbi:MAG TPA: F0F1 ATP synthase subunit delta [Gemmatimonadaceae bacterium]|nr:F0F1 ATP synthase subunit delta [Gemmatimonadaceae bacterium]
MNAEGIGRNYAEALLTLARKSDSVEEWGALLDAIAAGMREDPTLRAFLESPKLSASHKIEILEKALGRRVPPVFLRFIETVINKRRQMLIPEIASEYRLLIDEAENRVHAMVTVATEPTEPERDALARQLTRLFGKRVVPHISLNPAILGGVIVKVGDTVMDGSVRKRLSMLRQRMLATVHR